MNTTQTKARTLRLAPRHIMTGDILVERGQNGTTVESLVTNLEPKTMPRGGHGWNLSGISGPLGWYANQRRLTVKRSGPKGLGE